MASSDKELKERFLEEFRDLRSMKKAAEEIGISYDQVYRWKKVDKAFHEAITIIKDMFAEEVEANILNHALLEKDMKKHDATLGIFYLKGQRPQYKESFKVEHSGEVSLKDKCARK